MKKLLVSILVFVSMLSASVVALPTTASAQSTSGSCTTSILGLPTWYKYLEISPWPECEITGPNQEGTTDKFDWAKASSYIGLAVVEVLLRVAVLVAVGFVMYGGFRFITSQGDPEGAKAARETIINALIGVVVAIAAASIVSFLALRLTS